MNPYVKTQLTIQLSFFETVYLEEFFLPNTAVLYCLSVRCFLVQTYSKYTCLNNHHSHKHGKCYAFHLLFVFSHKSLHFYLLTCNQAETHLFYFELLCFFS